MRSLPLSVDLERAPQPPLLLVDIKEYIYCSGIACTKCNQAGYEENHIFGALNALDTLSGLGYFTLRWWTRNFHAVALLWSCDRLAENSFATGDNQYICDIYFTQRKIKLSCAQLLHSSTRLSGL